MQLIFLQLISNIFATTFAGWAQEQDPGIFLGSNSDCHSICNLMNLESFHVFLLS